VRHGNTTKAERDEDRVLTEVGKDQARWFRSKTRELGLAPFDLVLSPPATRAKQTAAIVAPWGVPMMVELPELGVEIPGENGARLNEVYSRLGYAPLADYLRELDMDYIMSRYAKAANAAIDAAVAKAGYAERVLVVGHSIMLNAIGAGVDRLNAQSAAPLLSSTSLGECEGFYIKEDGSVEFIRRD